MYRAFGSIVASIPKNARRPSAQCCSVFAPPLRRLFITTLTITRELGNCGIAQRFFHAAHNPHCLRIADCIPTRGLARATKRIQGHARLCSVGEIPVNHRRRLSACHTVVRAIKCGTSHVFYNCGKILDGMDDVSRASGSIEPWLGAINPPLQPVPPSTRQGRDDAAEVHQAGWRVRHLQFRCQLGADLRSGIRVASCYVVQPQVNDHLLNCGQEERGLFINLPVGALGQNRPSNHRELGQHRGKLFEKHCTVTQDLLVSFQDRCRRIGILCAAGSNRARCCKAAEVCQRWCHRTSHDNQHDASGHRLSH
mmetsp:Transcript_61385/g.155035  ORF Transcript_61385/g.155035 Transcript_61385/m.155035 type:complete len:310 (-) Transcript_61385:94-1023(-)